MRARPATGRRRRQRAAAAPRSLTSSSAVAAAAALLVLLLVVAQLPTPVRAQIGGSDDEGMAEAFGRPGYNSFAIHQPAARPQPQQYQGSMGGGPRYRVQEGAQGPGFFPMGEAGAAQAQAQAGPNVKAEKPSVHLMKVEKGKGLRYGGPGGAGKDEKQALELFREVAYAPQAAVHEKMMALYELALLYVTGGGHSVPQDLPRAVKTLSEAVHFAEAKHALAFFLATGFGGKPADDEAALKFESGAAEGGSNGATLALAYRFLYGLGGLEYNCEEALKLYKEVAKIAVEEYEAIPNLQLRKGQDEVALVEARKAQGDTDDVVRRRLLGAAAVMDAPGQALYEVAKMYDTGSFGASPDPKRAVEFYQAAAAKGHAGAMGDLGLMYALGSEATEGPHGLPVRGGGLPQDLDLAVDLLERASELGDGAAMNALAYLYQEGKGVDRDTGKAQTLFKRAALQDHPEALFHYAEHLLETGDLPSAMAAYHRAGELGFIYGAYKEGMLWEQGLDDEFVPRSCPNAAHAFKRAAEGGYWSAGPRFGFDLYQEGDFTGAVAVLSLAAEEGYEMAMVNAAYLLANRMGYSHDDADALALRLYERAAMQSPDHYYALGDLMLRMEARGLDTSSGMSGPVLGVAQALSYIETAAEHGNLQALRRLAEMHEGGEAGVVRKDARKALKYYRALLAALEAQEAEASGSGWSAFMDKTGIQWKITKLSFTEGVSNFVGGGGGAGADEDEVGEEEDGGMRGLDDIKVVGGKGHKWMGR